ncbi:YbaB/EbfC family nucleoid-associated protein [Actinoplanes sp. NPDC024001]|uniref:YbaB/EbfC family nucleoid-associated protein n=1 Tax=Actinoplanes sp. NPDC024001 TaxID=3154598 RepID=UPI0033D40B2B
MEVWGVAETAGGRIRVELDGDGRLWDLDVDPQAMSMPADEFRDALISAFTLAHDQVREQATAAAAGYAAAAPQDTTEVIQAADRRFAEISLALYDLTRRADRRW